MNIHDLRYTWRRSTDPGPVTLVLLLALLAGLLSPAETLAKRRKPKAPRTIPPAERIVLNHIAVLADSLPEQPRLALLRIPATQRRLLALKIYIGRRDEIPHGWAWSNREAADYRKTDEYRAAIEDVGKVRQAFAEMNPGYELGVTMEIRSLESQLQKWNSVTSVGIASRQIMDSCLAVIDDSAAAFGETPTDSSLTAFKRFLEGFEPDMEPTVAVPGLSQHGQLRAFDFKINRGRTLVAGTTAATIPDRWETPGWTERLREAILCASDRFAGPLDSPYEPWHYAYTPLGGEPRSIPEEQEHRREPEIEITTGDAVTGTR